VTYSARLLVVPRVCWTVGFQNCGHDTLQNWQLEIHLLERAVTTQGQKLKSPPNWELLRRTWRLPHKYIANPDMPLKCAHEFVTDFCPHKARRQNVSMYTMSNKNLSAWNFLIPEPEVTCGTVAIKIRVVILSPYLRIRGVSLPSIHYNQSHRVYINRRQQYICLIWN